MGHPTKLDEDDEHAVLQAAAADQRIKKVAAGRHARVLVGAIERGRRTADRKREAVVGYFDYAAGKSVAAVVDLDTKAVVEVDESSVQLQLSADEAREAERLAAAEPAIKELVGTRKLDPLTRLYFPAWAGRDDPPHRYAVVFARPSNHERRYAIVDLTVGKVAEVLSPDQIQKQ